MGDKTEQPGPEQRQKAAKVIEPIEGEDVEGHKKVVAKQTGDEPGPSQAKKKFTDSDEDDVEGHKLFAR